MTEIHVRLTGSADIPTIAALRAQWTGARSGSDFEAHVGAWIAAKGNRRLIWLATFRGEPAGLASLLEYHRMPRPDRLDSRWGYVGNMFVREDLRNRGIGAALLGRSSASTELAATPASCSPQPSAPCRSTAAPASSMPTRRWGTTG